MAIVLDSVDIEHFHHQRSSFVKHCSREAIIYVYKKDVECSFNTTCDREKLKMYPLIEG